MKALTIVLLLLALLTSALPAQTQTLSAAEAALDDVEIKTRTRYCGIARAGAWLRIDIIYDEHDQFYAAYGNGYARYPMAWSWTQNGTHSVSAYIWLRGSLVYSQTCTI